MHLNSLFSLFPHFSPAVAYIDPGTGSMVIQAVLATLVTVGYFMRKTISKVFSMFKKK